MTQERSHFLAGTSRDGMRFLPRRDESQAPLGFPFSQSGRGFAEDAAFSALAKRPKSVSALAFFSSNGTAARLSVENMVSFLVKNLTNKQFNLLSLQ